MRQREEMKVTLIRCVSSHRHLFEPNHARRVYLFVSFGKAYQNAPPILLVYHSPRVSVGDFITGLGDK